MKNDCPVCKELPFEIECPDSGVYVYMDEDGVLKRAKLIIYTEEDANE